MFLMSAWKDTKKYVSEAPPDARRMLAMLGCVAHHRHMCVTMSSPSSTRNRSPLNFSTKRSTCQDRRAYRSVDFLCHWVCGTLRTPLVGVFIVFFVVVGGSEQKK